MSENSKIEWTDHTFNPWMGCAKVSPGCAHCYAEELMDTRYGKARWGKGQPRVRTSTANWKLPLKWNRGPFVCGTCGQPFEELKGRQKLCEPIPGDSCHHCNSGRYRRPRVFCASLADWLDDEVPAEWRRDLLRLMFECKNLDWLMLTKRPENWRRLLTDFFVSCGSHWAAWESEVADWFNGFRIPPHIWIGTSVEDQERADERIPELLKIPARVRFLSVEPMLGPIDFSHNSGIGNPLIRGLADGARIDWAIFGGKSGPKARPCNIEWIRNGVKQCRAAGVAPFVKQLGANIRNTFVDTGEMTNQILFRDKKGGDMSEWPEDLRVREFPEVKP